MTDFSEHYPILLGLDEPSIVEDDDRDLPGQRSPSDSPTPAESLTVPGCGDLRSRADTAPGRTWRHLNTVQFRPSAVAPVRTAMHRRYSRHLPVGH